MFLKNLIVVVDCVFWFVLFGFFFDDFLFTFMSSPIFDREHVRSLERSFPYNFFWFDVWLKSHLNNEFPLGFDTLCTPFDWREDLSKCQALKLITYKYFRKNIFIEMIFILPWIAEEFLVVFINLSLFVFSIMFLSQRIAVGFAVGFARALFEYLLHYWEPICCTPRTPKLQTHLVVCNPLSEKNF